MRYAILFEMLEWAAKSDFAEDLLEHIIRQAREWAESDGKEDWDDYLVDALEMVAKYFYSKYRNS